MYALVFKGGTAQHWNDFAGDGTLTQSSLDLGFRQVAFFQVLVHQFFGRFSSGLNHVFAPLGSFSRQVRRNVAVFKLHALRSVIPDNRFHLDQIDNTGKEVFSADRHLDRHWVGFQARTHLIVDLEEVGAGTVHLVHEGQTWHFVLVSLTPYRFRLWLHAADCTVNHAGAIQHAHRTFHFNGEVNVAWGVDDVDVVGWEVVCHAFPEARNSSRGNRDAALLLLCHPVGGGSAIMDFAQLVVHAGVEQNALGGGRLTCIDVSGDTDIAVALNGGLAGHN